MVVLGPIVPDEQQHPASNSFNTLDGHTGHSTRRHPQPNDRVLTPKRARHPISSPVTGEPAGARSLRRSRTRPGSKSADPPAAAGQSLPEETPAGLIRL